MIRPRPGCDRFLALGVARCLIQSGLVAADLGSWSVGAEAFRKLALSRDLADWAHAADVSPREIEELADLYGRQRPGNIQVGWGLQRAAVRPIRAGSACHRTVKLSMASSAAPRVERPDAPSRGRNRAIQKF